MKTPREVLLEAKALIDSPDKWRQGTWSLDCGGRMCAADALFRVSPLLDERQPARTALLVVIAPQFNSIVEWNDTVDHAAVMRGFEQAANLREG